MLYRLCAFPDVVFDEPNECVYILIYNSFLISVCMFIVSKALLLSSDTVIVRAGATM